MLERVDNKVIGISRAKHHRFSESDPSVLGFALRDARGAPAGYVYVSRAGQIGPLAVTSAEFMACIDCRTEHAAEQGAENISAFVPGMCGDALKMSLDAGFRLGRTMVQLSSRPFGDWTCYALKGPGFM